MLWQHRDLAIPVTSLNILSDNFHEKLSYGQGNVVVWGTDYVLARTHVTFKNGCGDSTQIRGEANFSFRFSWRDSHGLNFPAEKY